MTESLAHAVGGRLLFASLEGAIVIALVWIVCRRREIRPAARAAVWWLASLKLIVTLLPLPAIAVPILPASTDSTAYTARPTGPAPVTPHAADGSTADTERTTSRIGRGPGMWPESVVMLWLALVAVQMARLLAAFRDVRRRIRRAAPVSPDEAAVIAEVARRIGLRRLPRALSSHEIDAPQVAGIYRPVLLLPLKGFSADERGMMLCHELMHIRRLDLAFGWIPAMAERLFFFHPLARLAAREYLTAREAACDAAVVRTLDVSPDDYGRMLIRLGIRAVEPTFTAAGSAASRSSLKRRLEMLHHSSSPFGSTRLAWLAAAAVAALIPLQLAARAPQSPEIPVAPAPKAAAVSAPAAQVAVPEPAPAASTATLQSRVAEMLHVIDLQHQQPDDAETMRRRAEEAARMLQLMRDNAERALRNREMQHLTEEYYRRLQELEARFNTQAVKASVERVAEDTRRQVEEAAGTIQFGRILEKQVELAQQQEILVRQQQQIAAQQQELAAEQRRLAEEAERIREELAAK